MASHEIELKAGLSADESSQMLRTLEADYGPGQAAAHLRTIYFDTPAQTLKSAGLSLRIRRENGRSVQTVKSGRAGLGGFQSVREFDDPVTGIKPRIEAISDRSVRESIEAAVQSTLLVPQFETRVCRTRWHVAEPHGEIEISIDEGDILADGRRATIREMELELKGGTPEALFDLADRLLGQTRACLTLDSKAARGFALVAGKDNPAEAMSSKPEPAAGSTDVETAFDAVLGMLAVAIAGNLYATLTRPDAEGPHQLRVALRRLRSALDLFSPIIDKAVAKHLKMTARDIARAVSPLRDADAQCEIVLAADHGFRGSSLKEALDQHREELWFETQELLRRKEATRFALQLQRLAVLGTWRRAKAKRLSSPLSSMGRAQLKRRWDRIAPLGDRLAILSEDERHNLRKKLKNFRYMIEMIDVNSIITIDVKALKRLQLALGALNDRAVLAAWSPSLKSFDAQARLAEIREALLSSGKQNADLAMGRACRQWRTLRHSAAF